VISNLEKKVLDYINHDEVIAWTQELVHIPSVYRPETGETEELAALWVKERLKEIGMTVSYYDVEPKRPNVIGLYKGSKEGKCLMFEGHTDVVTEGDVNKWEYNPFGGEIVGSRIYGRGSADMKGGLVAAISAVKAIIESGVVLKGSILIGALADEEGMMIGAKHFAKSKWAKDISAAIICEPEDNKICIAQKGVMWIKLKTMGKMAHGCMPRVGVNPITHMIMLLHKLKELENHEITRLGKDKLLGYPSITPTVIRAPIEGQGEEQNNVIPGQCQAILDIRLIPQQSSDDIKDEIKNIFKYLRKKDSTFSASMEVIETRLPTATPKHEPIVKVISQSYYDLTGIDPIYDGVPGTTDGTILNSYANIPIVTCGPGDTYIPHQVDEYIDIDQLIEATKLYTLTALRFLMVE
jgi:succinyl-diaminopimelate desuccinylase